jgi:hypothetical protein
MVHISPQGIYVRAPVGEKYRDFFAMMPKCDKDLPHLILQCELVGGGPGLEEKPYVWLTGALIVVDVLRVGRASSAGDPFWSRWTKGKTFLPVYGNSKIIQSLYWAQWYELSRVGMSSVFENEGTASAMFGDIPKDGLVLQTVDAPAELPHGRGSAMYVKWNLTADVVHPDQPGVIIQVPIDKSVRVSLDRGCYTVRVDKGRPNTAKELATLDRALSIQEFLVLVGARDPVKSPPPVSIETLCSLVLNIDRANTETGWKYATCVEIVRRYYETRVASDGGFMSQLKCMGTPVWPHLADEYLSREQKRIMMDCVMVSAGDAVRWPTGATRAFLRSYSSDAVTPVLMQKCYVVTTLLHGFCQHDVNLVMASAYARKVLGNEWLETGRVTTSTVPTTLLGILGMKDIDYGDLHDFYE